MRGGRKMADREPYKWITVKGKHIPVYKDEHGQDVFGNGREDLKSRKEVVDLIAGKDNEYNTNKELGELVNKIDVLWGQREKIENERKKLSEDIESEKYIDEETRKMAEGSMSDKELMRYGLHSLTEKGQQMQQRIDELRGQREKIEKDWEPLTERLKEIQHENYLTQYERFNIEPSTAGPQTRESYMGFKASETTTPYIDEMIKDGRAMLVEMSPKEYLQQVAYKIFDTSIERTANGVGYPQVNKYAEMMRQGVKFDTPYLNFRDKQQEGRHRATAAMLLGIERIPVVVVRKR